MRPRHAAEQHGSIVAKPIGGFRFISVVQLCMAWWCYRCKYIRLADLRIWFAAHECVARRCILSKGRIPNYSVEELARLTGRGGERSLRGSLRRLHAVGLLSWTKCSVTFAISPDELRIDDLSGFWIMLSKIENRRRKVPVPRRTQRLLADGAGKVMIATILGHLLRCLYYRKGIIVADGRCKASWIADAFGVDLRNVKAARKALQESHWLIRPQDRQWCRQRWGGKATINLSWSPIRAELPPHSEQTGTDSPPPESHTKPLTGLQHQKPAKGGPTGASGKEETTKAPSITHIDPADLHHTGRLLDLFRQASESGLIDGSKADRLRFVAAAEHAKAVGRHNPAGLFAHLIRNQLWHYITQADEDAAHARLKQRDYGDPRPPEPKRLSKPVPRSLSDDAKIVAVIRQYAAQHCNTGNPFDLLRRIRPGWTRDRWNQATVELDSRRFPKPDDL